MVDSLIEGKTRVRRRLCTFYTDSDPILSYMVKLLHLNKGDSLLEPCAGSGAFLKKIVSTHPNLRLQIDAVDIDKAAIQKIRDNYWHSENSKISARITDTLFDTTFDRMVSAGGYYDKIIGNPPYGAWQDYGRRNELKARYGGYVRETYSLFLRRCLDLLKPEGRLVFIIPDTFLALSVHKDLRKQLTEDFKIIEILTLPSRFFPGVSFGYSKLCIITIDKTKALNGHKIRIGNISVEPNELFYLTERKFENIKLGDVRRRTDRSFFIGASQQHRKLIENAAKTLGDYADCVTGFYSGDNQLFLKPLTKNVKGADSFEVVKRALVEFDTKCPNLIEGLNGKKIYIPIIKGRGPTAFAREPEWVVQWDKKTVQFYKKDKRARFQNPSYYFKGGLGVPMVRSKRLVAFSLGTNLFDQSVVGVFPRNSNHYFYILGFLNTEICNKLLCAINHTTNNSANYLKKIPLIISNEHISTVNSLVKKLISNPTDKESMSNLEIIFEKIYSSN